MLHSERVDLLAERVALLGTTETDPGLARVCTQLPLRTVLQFLFIYSFVHLFVVLSNLDCTETKTFEFQ